jgi:hypothetical protein
MGLDQSALVEDLDEPGVGAHRHALADEVAGDRIEGLRDLDVVIAVDLGVAVDGDVEADLGSSQEVGLLLLG